MAESKQFAVQTKEVRRRVQEITHAIVEITQARIRAAAESPLDGGLEECVAQAVAFGAMFHAAALQLPPDESIRDFVGKTVVLTDREVITVTAIEGDVATVHGATPYSDTEPPKALWARTGCILFTGESIYGDG